VCQNLAFGSLCHGEFTKLVNSSVRSVGRVLRVPRFERISIGMSEADSVRDRSEREHSKSDLQSNV
jgi:hypothetical protein